MRRISLRLTALMQMRPTRLQRVLVAFMISGMAVCLPLAIFRENPNYHADFGSAWFGVKAMLAGRNPYALVGPGLEFDAGWPLLYPATALVALIPFSFLSEETATALFVGISTFLLAYGATRNGWYLLPLFVTEAFLSSARLGQWSIIVSATIFFTWLSWLTAAKPNAFLPVVAAARSRNAVVAAGVGAGVLLLISMVLFPEWPTEWLAAVRASNGMEPPITRLGGPLVLLVLLRWRRPESWLILTMACVPQSWGWYGTLPLFVIPTTFSESVILAAVATVGGWIGSIVMPTPVSAAAFHAWVGGLIVMTIYVPAVAIILRRPNEGEPPYWLNWVLRIGYIRRLTAVRNSQTESPHQDSRTA